jgi:RND superfamily putative drug exporter
MTLVPALLTLMGKAAWSFPRWLDRITPHVDIEGTSLRPPQTLEEEQRQRELVSIR